MTRPNPPGRDKQPGRGSHGRAPEGISAKRANVVTSISDGPVCWRCGTPFAWTDEQTLARCTELARAAAVEVEERAAMAGLCPACAAGLAS
jgi:hypothetical protein